MNDFLLNFSLPPLVKSLETNLHAHIPLFAQLPGAILLNDLEILALITDLDPSENYVYRVNFAPSEVEQKIEQVIQQYRFHNCLPVYWQVGPYSLPVDLGNYLLACNFQFVARVPGMALDLQEIVIPPTARHQFAIVPVETGDQLRQWGTILSEVDGISDALRDGFYQVFKILGLGPGGDSQLFLGMVNDQAVATARLFCAGGVAGIWHVATSPEARGKGYGTAMTMATVQAGLNRGYRFGILYATPAGYGIYRRLGFQEFCHLDIYKYPA